MNEKKGKSGVNVRSMVYAAMFAVLIAVCSWISIPGNVPFTMQTFGIFCALAILGGKRGTASVVVYVLLGLIGLPVFTGFRGGAGVLFGTTGGYILGFVFAALVYWLITRLFGTRLWVMALAMVVSLAVCYAFGTAWFMVLYTKKSGAVSLGWALVNCVIPFILPDLLKIALAIAVSAGVKKRIRGL